MKKSIFVNVAAIMSAMVMTLSFASCEKDNGGDNGNGNGDGEKVERIIEKINVAYSLEFSEDVLRFYDVTVNYGTDTGVEKTEKLSTVKWSATKVYDKTNFPKSVFCKAVMTPKTDRPAIDPEAKYTVTKNKNCTVSATYTDGKTSILNSYANDSTNPVKGAKFEEYINKGERVVCDYVYDIKY